MTENKIIFDSKEVQKLWDLYDTGVKNRYGFMKIDKNYVSKEVFDLLMYSKDRGIKVLAVRKNGYLMTPGYEALVVRETIDFSVLDGNENPYREFELACVDIVLDDDDYENIGPYMLVGKNAECETLYSFKALELVRAVYGNKGMFELTEEAINKLENKQDIDGWRGYEDPDDSLLKEIIDRAFLESFHGKRVKPLYTYKVGNLCYLIIADRNSMDEVHWNILRYDEGLARRKYMWASQLDRTDERFVDNIGILIDYPIRQKEFEGLGYRISMSNDEFISLQLDMLI